MERFPVVIIGGGPAGCIASWYLSDAGIDHLLLEAHHHPRDKACADILTSKAIRELNGMHPDILGELQESGAVKDIWGTRLVIDGRKESDIPFRGLDGAADKASCLAVRRSELDERMWKSAVARTHCHGRTGARVISADQMNGEWRIETSEGQDFQSSLLIMATGSGRAPGHDHRNMDDKDVALGIRAYYRDVDGLTQDRCELFLEDELMPGGFYIAPMKNGLCNVNVVVRKDKVRKDDMKLQAVMDTFIQAHTELAQRFQNAERVGRVQGAPLALATGRSPMVADGLLYAGDAAGLIDLISANGIPQALLSGRMAADWAHRAVKKEAYSVEFLRGYEQGVQEAIREDVRMGRMLGPFLGYPLLCRWTLKGMSALMAEDGTGGLLPELLYSDQPLKTLAGHLNPLS